MAVLADLVTAVRRRVKDYTVTYLYVDDFYEESIEVMGLPRLNLDLETEYTVATLPAKYTFLLILRGAIEMCYVRGGESATGENAATTQTANVSVPNLSVSKNASTLKGADYWLDLAERLEEAYADALNSAGENPDSTVGQIEVGAMTRRSLLTGRKVGYEYDRPLTAPDLTVALTGSTVNLTWEKVETDWFTAYLIQRSASADMSSPTEIRDESDIQIEAYDDTPGVGTWYYRIGVENTNALVGWSTVATATVS